MKDGLFQILVVCTGNICRSPMGEGILRARLSSRAAEFATVVSAGVAAPEGIKASVHSVSVCRDNDIDISSHRSKQVTPAMIKASDLILTMEAHHRDAIIGMVPAAREKTFVLPDYAGEPSPFGVPDPIGHEVGMYRAVFKMIDGQISKSLPRIEALIAAADKSV